MVFAMEAREGPNTQDRAEHLTAETGHLLEDESMHRESLENLGRSRSSKKHVRIVLATEAREGLTLKTKPSVLRGAAH